MPCQPATPAPLLPVAHAHHGASVLPFQQVPPPSSFAGLQGTGPVGLLSAERREHLEEDLGDFV